MNVRPPWDAVPKTPPLGPVKLIERPLEKFPESPTLLIGLEEWR